MGTWALTREWALARETTVCPKTSKDKDIMHLLRCLHFFATVHDIALRAVHVPGTAADAISRNNMQVLRQVVPAADGIPDRVSPDLWDLLVQRQPDWISTGGCC